MKSNENKRHKHHIAVRLYDNPKFGKTFGRGLYHNALFNGTVDLPVLRLKYLIDLVQYEQWQHTAHTDEDIEALNTVINEMSAKDIDIESVSNRTNILCSWMKRFDSNMSKPKVAGFAVLDIRSCDMLVVLHDERNDVAFAETFSMRGCKDPSDGQRSPNYFASNYDADTRMPLAA
jgi:hypothetical protein